MINLVTLKIIDGSLVHVNPVHVAAVVATRDPKIVSVVLASGMTYDVEQSEDRPVHIFLTKPHTPYVR